MKYFSVLLISIFFFAGCKKEEYGNVRQQIKATTSQLKSKAELPKGTQELKYTQFGDFITSITPTSCTGELHVVRFVSDTIGYNDMLTLVMRHPHLGEELVYADFTNNSVITLVPTINGVNTIIQNSDGQGWFFKENVTMKLLWMRMGIKQVIELPSEYTNVELSQFNGMSSQRVGNILTTGILPLNQVVAELSILGDVIEFYFGMTNNTFIDYRYWFENNVQTYAIRSSYYNEWTMTPPQADQTKTYTSTIGFINNNIIQIYAGDDNIPFTSDDIIVLEPRFWEKIYVTVNES